jgi:hypothetical protein
VFPNQVRAGKKLQDSDLFGATEVFAGAGVSIAGRPRLTICRKPYEFGVKVGIALKRQGSLILGPRFFPGNPYDGHTLNEHDEQVTILIQALGTTPQTTFVDFGYRGVDKNNLGLDIKHHGKSKSLTVEV